MMYRFGGNTRLVVNHHYRHITTAPAPAGGSPTPTTTVPLHETPSRHVSNPPTASTPPTQAATTLTLTQAATHHRETHPHRPCLVWGERGPILVCAHPRTTHFDCATVNLAASLASHSSPVSPVSPVSLAYSAHPAILQYLASLCPRLASSAYSDS